MEQSRILEVTQYDVEVWDSRTLTYVADLSNILTSELALTWKLNDLDEINFSIDLVQFRNKCKEMGVKAKEVISPYRHDIRIKRNGKYILGGQVVETNFTINRDSGDTMEIRVTGFLNLLKDQYTTIGYNKMSYPEIAKALIKEAQSPDNILKNTNVATDFKYWIPVYAQAFREVKDNDPPFITIATRRQPSGLPEWGGIAQKTNIPAGRRIMIEFELRTNVEQNTYVHERNGSPEAANAQENFMSFKTSPDSQWHKYKGGPFMVSYDNPYFYIEFNRPDSFCHIKNLRVYYAEDGYEQANHSISIGHDDTLNYPKTHERNYELQNIKQAIQNLTKLEKENFDFDFSYDRAFNLYTKKGSDKGIELVYPGNVDSMSINRSASSLFNKITEIGSGIGEARYEVTAFGRESQILYGNREKAETLNDVKNLETLEAHAKGNLYKYESPTDNPEVTISDGSVNPGNIEVGDIVLLKIVDDEYLETVNGKYRVEGINVSVSLENQETVKLTLNKIQKPLGRKKLIRYIRFRMNGNTRNEYNHLREVYVFGPNSKGQIVDLIRSAPIVENGVQKPDRLWDKSAGPGADMAEWVGNNNFTIDLGSPMEVSKIVFIPYFDDERKYRDIRISVGLEYGERENDLENVLIYSQTLSATSRGWIMSGIQEI